VEFTEEQGKMYYFKYQLLDLTDDDDGGDGDDSGGEDVFLPVATTRPETILGDTAVRTNKPALSLNPPFGPPYLPIQDREKVLW
jgi:valyl-tRNA synthetase